MFPEMKQAISILQNLVGELKGIREALEKANELRTLELRTKAILP